jgi:hypothetical protein
MGAFGSCLVLPCQYWHANNLAQESAAKVLPKIWQRFVKESLQGS